MASTFFLAPIPIWVEVDKNGQPAGNAYLRARSSLDHSQVKPVFQTADNTTPWPVNEFGDIQFRPNGTQGPFYWEDNGTGELYYLQIFNQDYELLDTINIYPIVGGGGSGPITTIQSITNHIINGQFQFFVGNYPIMPIPNGLTPIQPTSQYGGWFFYSNMVGNTDSIDFERPSLSATSPPNNPLHIFKYSCTVAGSGTRLDLVYKTPDVKTYSNEQISIQFQVQASGAAPSGVQGELVIHQFFGTGGSPSSEVFSTPIPYVFGDNVFVPISITLTVDSVAGKSFGTNNDDYFEILIRFPIGIVGDYRLTNVMQVSGTVLPSSYIYDLYIETYYKLAAYYLGGTVGDTISSYNPSQRLGWLRFQDGQTIGGPNSVGATFQTFFMGYSLFNLYEVWWNGVQGITGQPIVIGGAGSTALADWNAGKKIIVPLTANRVVATVNGTAHALSEAAGSETKVIPLSALPGHTHDITLPLKNLPVSINYASGGNVAHFALTTDTTYPTTSTGAGGNFDVRQATTYRWSFVKL